MNNNDRVIPTGKFIARIDEEQCIGCTLCIKACPFDAIIGASKQMHTVMIHYCTGCKLCLPPCPVDCISINTNIFFNEACKDISSDEISALKKKFATFAKHNKRQQALRLEIIKKAKQALFQRKKQELLDKK